ncbi:unnamed protein product [Nezara viridula]|uniref:E3 ubiquitin-protein ligase TM129 n=1 Tax=Nezara viridula TaxID=85310 RepID=A0A9P0HLU1_NEZVI|nr:unnamed protein product [Nezara viridula]
MANIPLDPNNVISPTSLYTLFYLTFCIFFIFPTREFISLGITVEGIFEWFLKCEFENFIFYQIRRSCVTLIVHSILPLGYILFLLLLTDKIDVLLVTNIWMHTFLVFSLLFPLLMCCLILYWNKKGSWDNHPIAKSLQRFCDPNTSWRQLSSDINIEFRSIDKVSLQTSTIHRVIATDNWIMKVSPYRLDIAHQSDSVLVLCQADLHHVSVDGQGVVQYLNIEVKTTRRGVKSFFIRCNATDFHLLQHKVDRPISILQGIVFYKTLTEQFLEVFEENVKKNPPYILPKDEQLDQCIGCMVAEPSVKLVKCCQDPEPCTKCYCRPLWCLSCMGRWFASRQEQDQPETWLGSTCTCPLCRSVFCILDVCPLEKTS